jgi:hypothetical protein
VTACRAGGTVDSTSVENGIKRDLSTAAEVKSAKCPDNVKSEDGANFTCDVTFTTGATGKTAVTEDSSKSFTYDLQNGSVRISGKAVAAQLKQVLDRQGIQSVTAQCPRTVAVKLNTALTCGSITFAFSNEDGTVDPSTVQTP